MKLQVSLEIPDELEGALNQAKALFQIDERLVVQAALVHALRRVCADMPPGSDFSESLAADQATLQAQVHRRSQLIVVLEKAVADALAVNFALRHLLDVEPQKKD